MLLQYTRKPSGVKTGCLAAVNVNGIVGIGFSKCKNTDRFDKKLARTIAIERASHIAKSTRFYLCPVSMESDFADMVDRVISYYGEDVTICVPPHPKGSPIASLPARVSGCPSPIMVVN